MTAVKAKMTETPRKISLSGGRSSAYMLRLLIDDGLRDTDHVLFANTGFEHEATLVFLRDIEKHWGVPIVWLEHQSRKEDNKNKLYRDTPDDPGYRIVNFDTANRDGTPFREATYDRMPIQGERNCTSRAKILVMRRYMLQQGIKEYDTIMGIRADEPHRGVSDKKRQGRR